jgi:flagellar basal-body rod modification protein FlgD
MSSPIGNVGVTAPTAPATSTPATADAANKNMFLQLLVAQMKNQDPSNPTDSSTYMTQMATFSEVEQLDNMAASQATMTSATQLQSAVSMVGHTVSYGAGADAASGVVAGVTVVSGVAQLLVGKDKVALTDVTGVTP